MKKMHHPVVREWQARAREKSYPYGEAAFGRGLIVVSAVCDRDQCVVDNVQVDARLRWLASNSAARPRRVQLRSLFFQESCVWKGPGSNWEEGKSVIGKTIVVDETRRVDCFSSRSETAGLFEVVSPGTETAMTDCHWELKLRQIQNVFFALGVKGSMGNKKEGTVIFDWGSALWKALEGLPGGQILIGPLNKAVDDTTSALRHEELLSRLQAAAALDKELLAACLGVCTDVAEARKVLDLVVDLLRPREGMICTVFEKRMDIQPRDGAWVLPMSSNYLYGILCEFFENNIDELDHIGRINGLRMRGGGDRNRIWNFVQRLRLCDDTVLKSVIRQLAETVNRSDELRFLAEYLRVKATAAKSGR